MKFLEKLQYLFHSFVLFFLEAQLFSRQNLREWSWRLPPSPQSVGREFVRQYYTLLNNAPTHLHRFYNNQSSFVHGGLDPPNHETSPMIGQKQIHQKIQQLNFRDCHAKITQVDAQATLGNGVVVQVTGELSNAGQPMRRFTQTFVLAAQSPKKYYVHNDIFRYQDEIVFEDGCDADRSETEDEMVQESPVMNEVSPITQQSMPYYNPNPAPLPPTLTPVPLHHGQPTPNLSHIIPSPPVAAVNGSAHPDDINIIPGGPLPQHVLPSMQPPTISTMGNLQPALPPLSPLMPADDPQQVVDESPIEPTMDSNYMSEDNLDMQEVNHDAAMSSEPKTYATLLKSSGGSPSYGTMPQMTNAYNVPQKPPSPVSMVFNSPIQPTRYDNRDACVPLAQTGNQIPGTMGQQRIGGNRGPRNSNNNINQQPRPPPRQEPPPRIASGKNSFSEEPIINYDERKKPQGYGSSPFLSAGDTNQLFLGNIPHIATEDELRDIFASFGPILDLRIHSKPALKGIPGPPRAPPNYGFITYENLQAVQECLAARPIRYPFNDKDGTVLNVEEKKTKDRMSYGGGGNRIGLDNGGPRNRDNGPRRGLGPVRNIGGGPPVGGGGNAGRPTSFNRPPNRNSNNTFNNRR